MASEIVARADAPSNNAELQNRIATFNQAVGGAQAVEIQLPPPPKAARLALHLVATVARPGAPLYAGPQLCFPPTIGTPEPATADARAGLLRLSPEAEIQLLIAWVPGEVGTGVIFTPAAS